MKKLLNLFTTIALSVLAMVSFSACSDDDDSNNKCYFTCVIDGLSITGTSESEVQVYSYMSDVENAYFRVLGMTSAENSLIVEGDYNTLKNQMKTKFESVQLPAAPVDIDAQYSFTIVLHGSPLSGASDLEKMDVVASKTFSN